MKASLVVVLCLASVVLVQAKPNAYRQLLAKKAKMVEQELKQKQVLPQNMDKLEYRMNKITRPFERYLQQPLTEVPIAVTQALFQNYFDELIDVQTRCKELYLADYLTGLLEFEFKFDHNIVYFVRDALAALPMDVRPSSAEVMSLLLKIKIGVFGPIQDSVDAVTADYGIVPASGIFKDLALFTFTTENVNAWTLDDALQAVNDLTVKWHAQNTDAACSGTVKAGIISSLQMSLLDAVPKMDRCLAQDTVLSIIRGMGIDIPEADLIALTTVIRNALITKQDFLMDIIDSSTHASMISFRIDNLFNGVLFDAFAIAGVQQGY